MEKASAFVPGHISGFFQVHDEPEDPARRGSRNCGPCIDGGVTTIVEVEDSSAPELKVFINDRKKPAETTRTAVDELLEYERNVSVKVRHSVQAPIGAGYGMSGAGVLGAVLALSEVLGLGLNRREVLSMAHEAEVICKSGLGDVGPQIGGGLVVGLEPGSPPYGKWKRIDVPGDLGAVCGTFGSLPTPKFLADSNFREKSKKLGETAMKDLLFERSAKNFMEVSQTFATGLGVFDEDFKEILAEISAKSPLGASAVMLGRAIFALGPASELDDLKQVFLDYFDSESVMVTSVDFEGARILR